jgi:hypothetical protein
MLNDAAQSGREYWFVLDEIFRGTNTLERVSAGGAVLNYLTSHGLVIASTHDHELCTLLCNDFDLYHFSEVINGNEARFDYRLRQGPCTTRNAIKLMAIAGFPKSVTDLADKLAAGDHSLPSSNKGASHFLANNASSVGSGPLAPPCGERDRESPPACHGDSTILAPPCGERDRERGSPDRGPIDPGIVCDKRASSPLPSPP